MSQKPKIEIYSMTVCPYCVQAKDLLKRKGFSFEEIMIDKIENGRELVMKKTGGQRSVPQIFVNDQYLGDEDVLFALEKKGQLEATLNAM